MALLLVCLRERVDTVARRLIYCTMSLAGAGSIPGMSTVNQTGHPCRIGKFVAISRRLDGDSRILGMLKRAGGKVAGVWTMLPLEQTAMRRFPVPFARVSLELAQGAK